MTGRRARALARLLAAGLALGANLVLTRTLLLGLELHAPLFPAARLDTIPVRVPLDRPLVMLSLTWRAGRAPAWDRAD